MLNDIDEFIAALRLAAPQLATAIDQAKTVMLAQRQGRIAAVQARMDQSVKPSLTVSGVEPSTI